MILQYEPRYTNMFFFYDPEDVEDFDVTIFRIMNMIKAFLILLAWLGSGLLCKVDTPNLYDMEKDSSEPQS